LLRLLKCSVRRQTPERRILIRPSPLQRFDPLPGPLLDLLHPE
jgi:hypothetical protein